MRPLSLCPPSSSHNVELIERSFEIYSVTDLKSKIASLSPENRKKMAVAALVMAKVKAHQASQPSARGWKIDELD